MWRRGAERAWNHDGGNNRGGDNQNASDVLSTVWPGLASRSFLLHLGCKAAVERVRVQEKALSKAALLYRWPCCAKQQAVAETCPTPHPLQPRSLPYRVEKVRSWSLGVEWGWAWSTPLCGGEELKGPGTMTGVTIAGETAKTRQMFFRPFGQPPQPLIPVVFGLKGRC